MTQSNKARIVELHDLAAHAHTAAAQAHGRGEHLTGHELSQQAHEHSINAQRLSKEIAEQEKKGVGGD
jgi:hypothetical protein